MSEKYIRVEDVQDNSIAAGLCDGQGTLFGADIVFCLSYIDTTVPTYTPAEIMAQQWVPVSNPPKQPGRCHIFLQSGDQGIAYFNGSSFVGWAGITHWMPLPRPPRDDV